MQPARLSPLISAALGCLVVMGIGAFYFIATPSQNIQLILLSIIIVFAVFAIFYFNWRLTHHNPKRQEPQRRLSLTAQSNLEAQVRILENDLDNLTEIVKDLATMVEAQQKAIAELTVKPLNKVIAPQDLTFFLRPIVQLSNKTTKFYEALIDKNEEKSTDYLWKLSNGLHLLSKLKAKSPELKLLLSYPFQKLGEKTLISTLMLHRSMLASLIIDIEGLENLELSQTLIDQMRILNRLGVQFSLSNVGTLLQSSRLKSIAQFKEAGVVMVRHSASKIDQESFVKGDIERLTQSNIHLVVDNIDDNTNLSALIALGVTFGQGPTLGAARPVKDDMLIQQTSTQKPANNVAPNLRKTG